MVYRWVSTQSEQERIRANLWKTLIKRGIQSVCERSLSNHCVPFLRGDCSQRERHRGGCRFIRQAKTPSPPNDPTFCRASAALSQVWPLIIGEGKRSQLFFFPHNRERHDLPLRVPGIAGLIGVVGFIVEHGSAMFKCEGSSPVKITLAVKGHRLDDLAVGAIELDLRALVGYLQNHALTAPCAFLHSMRFCTDSSVNAGKLKAHRMRD